MIYLILNIALYLLMALICGAAAGWLARNNNALREEEELRRAVTELKDKLSQCESLLRGRDAQLNSLRAEVKAKDAAEVDPVAKELLTSMKVCKGNQGTLIQIIETLGVLRSKTTASALCRRINSRA